MVNVFSILVASLAAKLKCENTGGVTEKKPALRPISMVKLFCESSGTTSIQ